MTSCLLPFISFASYILKIMMPLTEIEFELPALQYQRMGYPGLKQGEPLTVILDGGVLLPDPGADSWFAVQKEPPAPRFKQVGPAFYAFYWADQRS